MPSPECLVSIPDSLLRYFRATWQIRLQVFSTNLRKNDSAMAIPYVFSYMRSYSREGKYMGTFLKLLFSFLVGLSNYFHER